MAKPPVCELCKRPIVGPAYRRQQFEAVCLRGRDAEGHLYDCDGEDLALEQRLIPSVKLLD